MRGFSSPEHGTKYAGGVRIYRPVAMVPQKRIDEMKMKFLTIVLFVLCLTVSENGRSQDTASHWSVVTAKSFITRFPNPDTMYCCGNTNHFSWQAGYVMFSMEKLWKATGDPVYYNYIKRYVDQQVDEQGNVADFDSNALDNFLPGYAILFMYEQTHLEKYKTAAQKIRAGFDTYPRNANGLFWHGTRAPHQVWVDGLFMGQIFLARYGKTIGDSEYAFNEVVKQMTLAAERCQKENGLLLHGWDESTKASWANKTTGLAPEVWSEGLGWYAVLIADVFDYLPKDHPGYPKIFAIRQKLCKGLKEVQDTKTGRWFQVVDKPNEPGNWNETSGTGMYMYLLKRSVDQGFLPAAEYAPVIRRAYAGIIQQARTNEKGFIDLYDCSSIGIKNNYQEYITSPKEISPFGAFGSFIIATSLVEFAQ
jgi:rhamnogalacturonyl hydrolase YesR